MLCITSTDQNVFFFWINIYGYGCKHMNLIDKCLKSTMIWIYWSAWTRFNTLLLLLFCLKIIQKREGIYFIEREMKTIDSSSSSISPEFTTFLCRMFQFRTKVKIPTNTINIINNSKFRRRWIVLGVSIVVTCRSF